MATTRSKAPAKKAPAKRKGAKKAPAKKAPKLTIPQKTVMCANKAALQLDHGVVMGYILQPDTSKKFRRCIKSTGSRAQVWKGERAFTRTRNGFKLKPGKNGEIKRGRSGLVAKSHWEQGGLSKSDLFQDSRSGRIKSKRASAKAKKQYKEQRKDKEWADMWDSYTKEKTTKKSAHQKREACKKQGKVLNPKTQKCRKPRR